jgi:hypothetical protein
MSNLFRTWPKWPDVYESTAQPNDVKAALSQEPLTAFDTTPKQTINGLLDRYKVHHTLLTIVSLQQQRAYTN